MLVAGGTAAGAVALAARQLLRLLGRYQERRLAREGRALVRWWTVLGDVPAEVLTPPLRRLIGRIMSRRLAAAGRVSPAHPYLQAQREQINRFMGGSAVGTATRSARSGLEQDRRRRIQALEALLELLEHSATDRLVSAGELASGRAAVARALGELEFLATRQTNLEADALRRVTRAIGNGAAPWTRQSSNALPTQ
jgi:hypothetical protein